MESYEGHVEFNDRPSLMEGWVSMAGLLSWSLDSSLCVAQGASAEYAPGAARFTPLRADDVGDVLCPNLGRR
jgi:hypothetical protein